jgi:hypothetical protein
VGCGEGKDEASGSQIWSTSWNHHEAHGKWMVVEDLIVEYLQWLHTGIADRPPCVVILDVYPAHRTDTAVAAAEGCDIELLFVSAGGESEYQLIDYRIFGELKSRARVEIARLTSHGGGVDVEHNQSFGISERCWNAILGENIPKAWGLSRLDQSSMHQ